MIRLVLRRLSGLPGDGTHPGLGSAQGLRSADTGKTADYAEFGHARKFLE
jgi:hypothetical protein